MKLRKRELISYKEKLRIEISYLFSVINLLLDDESQDPQEIQTYKDNIETIISTALIAVRGLEQAFSQERVINLNTESCIEFVTRFKPFKDAQLVIYYRYILDKLIKYKYDEDLIIEKLQSNFIFDINTLKNLDEKGFITAFYQYVVIQDMKIQRMHIELVFQFHLYMLCLNSTSADEITMQMILSSVLENDFSANYFYDEHFASFQKITNLGSRNIYNKVFNQIRFYLGQFVCKK